MYAYFFLCSYEAEHPDPLPNTCPKHKGVQRFLTPGGEQQVSEVQTGMRSNTCTLVSQQSSARSVLLLTAISHPVTPSPAHQRPFFNRDGPVQTRNPRNRPGLILQPSRSGLSNPHSSPFSLLVINSEDDVSVRIPGATKGNQRCTFFLSGLINVMPGKCKCRDN